MREDDRIEGGNSKERAMVWFRVSLYGFARLRSTPARSKLA